MDKAARDGGQVLQLEASLEPALSAPTGVSAGGHPGLVPGTWPKHRSSHFYCLITHNTL